MVVTCHADGACDLTDCCHALCNVIVYTREGRYTISKKLLRVGAMLLFIGLSDP